MSKSESQKNSYAGNGKRYNLAMKEKILAEAETEKVSEVARRYGVNKATIYLWRKERAFHKAFSSKNTLTTDLNQTVTDS